MSTGMLDRLADEGDAMTPLGSRSLFDESADRDTKANACSRVIAELEPSAGGVRLRVTEDDAHYEVTASCCDVAADAFDVQLDRDRLWIGRTGQRTGETGGGAVRCGERRSVDRLLSLVFDHPIDAGASHGESADGWLHLSLRKRAAPNPVA